MRPLLGRRSRGLLLLALGLVAIGTPFVAGRWTVALLGLTLVIGGGAALINAIFATESRAGRTSYTAGAALMVVGLIVFAAPTMVVGGLLTLLAVALALDGASRLVAAARRAGGPERWWSLFNGLVNLALALVAWRWRASVSLAALGVLLGAYILSHAWSMLLAPGEGDGAGRRAEAEGPPDRLLGIPPNAEFGRRVAEAASAETSRERFDRHWMVVLVIVFFAIHAARTQADWSWLGLLSPFVAVAGDVVVAVLLAALIVLPIRLLWRKATRLVERRVWRRRLATSSADVPFGERLAYRWVDGRLQWAVRLGRARGSLPLALQTALRTGLPLVALLVAINPIWGFSWFFNSENWASAVWQEMTETRVDLWREAMVRAVEQGRPGGEAASLFEVVPEGVRNSRDFSFLVIGDTGEGDPSQHSLRDRYLELGRRPDVKFLAVASDIIYPDGKMKDYEFNFYLPFKGFEKPIYAIPGNHDWFDALDAFLANFLEPSAARASLRARREADLGVTPLAEAKMDALVSEAARLRRLYGVRIGLQRAPFFEVHGEVFSLIAVDTGILRTIDPAQLAWLEQALARAAGRFTMVILGHPLYAGGAYQGAADEPFAAIHAVLRAHRVPIVMAGDTHDFEYYRERREGAGGPDVTHHFVNGGGGAYLSIGTALAWPAAPAVVDWAFYPRADAVRSKLDNETPRWKRPIWWWVKHLGGWPIPAETFSGAFDFNRAPFFQSFMEVRVEGSVGQVRLILHGVNGPLRWRDIQVGGSAAPPGTSGDDAVEFVVPVEPAY